MHLSIPGICLFFAGIAGTVIEPPKMIPWLIVAAAGIFMLL